MSGNLKPMEFHIINNTIEGSKNRIEITAVTFFFTWLLVDIDKNFGCLKV